MCGMLSWCLWADSLMSSCLPDDNTHISFLTWSQRCWHATTDRKYFMSFRWIFRIECWEIQHESQFRNVKRSSCMCHLWSNGLIILAPVYLSRYLTSFPSFLPSGGGSIPALCGWTRRKIQRLGCSTRCCWTGNGETDESRSTQWRRAEWQRDAKQTQRHLKWLQQDIKWTHKDAK